MLKKLMHRLLHSTSHSHKRKYSSSDRYYERKRRSSSDLGYKNSHNGHQYYKDKRRHYSSS
ncbi:hypothetical protein ACWHAM_21575 [Paenibacillus terrae]